MLLKNVAGQGVYLYAYILATGLPDTGDAANITGHYMLDGVDHAGFGTANPTEMSGGVYWQPLAQGETNANATGFRWASSTAGVQIAPLLVFTTGVNLPTAAPAASNGLITVGTSSGQLNPASGGVDLQTIKTQTVTCSAGVTIEPFVGTTTAALAVDASGRVILQPTQTGVTIPVVTTVTNQLTAAQVASGVWQDATSGDFAVANSIGKSLYTSGNVPGAASGLALVGSNMGTVSSVTAAVSISTSEVLSSPRSLNSIADGSITVNDARWCAVAAAAGKEQVSGTTYTVMTPSTGTTIRSFTLDSGTAPTQRS